MNHRDEILVTGANGFVGRALCGALRARGMPVRAAVRGAAADGAQGEPHSGVVAVGPLDGATDWSAALAGCATVIHLAARVHMMAEPDSDPLRAYRLVNVDASVNLARQACAAGVKRFVFVSSIKVNGEGGARPYRASDAPAPCDPYGQSKLEAELALLDLGRTSGMQVVIVRPPLVYGPGVKANFLNLIKLVRKGLPLPFGRTAARRSMVALDNLVDLLIVCARHPRAPGQVFLVSDGIDLTLGELVGMIARAMGKRLVLLPVPVGLMRAAAALLGKRAIADRLFGALQVDIGPTCATLDWSPVVTPYSAIEHTVAHFLTHPSSTP